jgi:hypothetical protein
MLEIAVEGPTNAFGSIRAVDDSPALRSFLIYRTAAGGSTGPPRPHQLTLRPQTAPTERFSHESRRPQP